MERFMKILYGTGNSAKLSHMRKRLEPLGLQIVGLSDLKVEIPRVEETGNSPLENARIKALAYYKAFKLPVFSCDSGLYFSGLPKELQPGVHVRNINNKCLTDEEMIEYYSSLAEKYGDLEARYKNAICLVMKEDEIYESMAEDLSGEKFIITCKPHEKREQGFPLDSLSIHIPTGKYYYDIDNIEVDEVAIENGFVRFFRNVIENEGITPYGEKSIRK